MATTLEKYVPEAIETYEPRDAAEAYKMAGILVKSGLLPNGVSSVEAAFTIIVTGKELGLTVMQSLRSVHVIKGRPTLSADLILALVKRSSVCQYFQLVTSTDKIATYRTERRGEASTEMSFTIEQAQRASLLGNDNWKRFPEAMLRARCISALARAVYPDVVLGVYETSELDVVPKAADSSRMLTSNADGVIETPSPLESDANLDAELAASLALEAMRRAETVGALQEAWADARKHWKKLSQEQQDMLQATKDEKKEAFLAERTGTTEAAQ